jgi:hypothetical protein
MFRPQPIILSLAAFLFLTATAAQAQWGPGQQDHSRIHIGAVVRVSRRRR